MDAKLFPCLETSSFLAYIADNSPLGIHRQGYNGVAGLIPRHSGNNLFVPTYAGMNYETISLTGMPTYRHEATRDDHQSKFEPRKEAMHIDSVDAEKVVLVQPESPHSGVEARITFRVEEPHYLHQRIELTFHRQFCGPDESSAFTSLWASYLHMPPDRHLYLKPDWQLGDELDHWFGLTSAGHGAAGYEYRRLPDGRQLCAADHLEAMRAADPLTLEDLDSLPESGWPMRALPRASSGDAPLSFYYGLCHDEQLLLKIFRQPEHFRLAYSPCGGGEEPAWCPAWDYVLKLGQASPGTTHVWDVCLVVKPYCGRADVVDEIRRYMRAD